MAQRTQKQRLLAALQTRGATIVKETRTTVTVAYPFLLKTDGGERFLYIGNSGSFRVGKTKSESIPWDRFKVTLLGEQP